MEKHGIPRKLINITEVCLTESKARVKMDAEISKSFLINTG